MTAAGFPWFLNAVSYANPNTSGNVTGIDLTLMGNNGCTVTADGTAAAMNNGKIDHAARHRGGHREPGSPIHGRLKSSLIAG